MRYAVKHRSTFTYAAKVALSQHHLHLRPRTCERQSVIEERIAVEPNPIVFEERQDYFGNWVADMTVQEPHNRLAVKSSSLVEVTAPPERRPAESPPWERVAAELEGASKGEVLDAQEFVFGSPHVLLGEEVLAMARAVMMPGRPFLEGLVALTRTIYRDFTYKGGVTDIYTPVSEVIRKKQGVCQDFAHLEIACLRALGLAARYVSGYLLTHPPEGQPRRIGADASHAWISAWCPGLGWIDADPTNDLLVGEEHVTLAWGRDYGDVSPITGFVVGGGEHQLSVAVDVIPLS